MSRDSNIDIYNLIKYLELLVDSTILYNGRKTIDTNGPFYFDYEGEVNIDKMGREGINSFGLLNVISNKFCLALPDNGRTWNEYLSNKKPINDNQEYEKGTLLLDQNDNIAIVYSSNGSLKNSKIVYVNKESSIMIGDYNSNLYNFAVLPRNWFF